MRQSNCLSIVVCDHGAIQPLPACAKLTQHKAQRLLLDATQKRFIIFEHKVSFKSSKSSTKVAMARNCGHGAAFSLPALSINLLGRYAGASKHFKIQRSKQQ
jgi:hypothetical protein